MTVVSPLRIRLPALFCLRLEGEDPYRRVRPRGKLFGVVLRVSELLLDYALGRNVRRRFGGVVHPVHCLTRGNVTFYANGTQLENALWQQAYKVGVLFHAFTCGLRTRSNRPLGRTAGPLPLCWSCSSVFLAFPTMPPFPRAEVAM